MAVTAAVDEAQSEVTAVTLLGQVRPIQEAEAVVDSGTQTVMQALAVLAL